jgi:hypothetical protein
MFRVEQETSVITGGRQHHLPPAFTLVCCSPYSSTLNMEAICSSETSVEFQRITRRYRCGNFKSQHYNNTPPLPHIVTNICCNRRPPPSPKFLRSTPLARDRCHLNSSTIRCLAPSRTLAQLVTLWKRRTSAIPSFLTAGLFFLANNNSKVPYTCAACYSLWSSLYPTSVHIS